MPSMPSRPPRAKKTLSVAERQQRMLDNTRYLVQWLKRHPCVDCGENDPLFLQCDHVKGQKLFNIGDALKTATLAELKAELAKCVGRCANHHQRRHMVEKNTLRYRIVTKQL